MKTILIQQASGTYTKFLDLTEKRHQAYAAKFDITYFAVRGNVQFERAPHWNKISLIRQTLALKFDLLIWLDADTLIRGVDTDLRLALGKGPPIGMCRHATSWENQDWHFNSGVIFIRNTALSRSFFNHVWKAGPVDHPWHEQVRINELSRIYPRAVQTISDTWNSASHVNPCPNPVIEAWHGRGISALSLMQAALAETGAACEVATPR